MILIILLFLIVRANIVKLSKVFVTDYLFIRMGIQQFKVCRIYLHSQGVLKLFQRAPDYYLKCIKGPIALSVVLFHVNVYREVILIVTHDSSSIINDRDKLTLCFT